MATFAFASAPAAAARPTVAASSSRAALAPRLASSMRLSSGMTGTPLRIAEVASRPAPRARAQAFGPMARQGGGGQGGRGKDEEDDGFSERVVQVRRVTKVVKGGKQLSFRAVVSFGACAPAARAQPPCAHFAHLPAPPPPIFAPR
jgi:hypothetical protein